MPNPFEVQGVDPLKALMFQQQGANAGYENALKPLQVSQQLQQLQARGVLSQLMQGGNADLGQVSAQFLAAGGDPQTAALLQNIQSQRQQRDLAERQFQLSTKQAEEKPQYMKDDNGNIIKIEPYGRGASAVVPTGTPAPTNPFAVQGKMSADEAKTALFADRAASAHEIINKNEGIYSFDNPKGGFFKGMAESNLPESVTRQIAGPEQQQMMNAKRSFVNALLRRESGAAINASEFASYDKEYFPQPGDDKSVVEQKRLHRAEVIAGLAREGGKNYRPTFALDQQGQLTRTGPQVGGIQRSASAAADPLAAARDAITKGAPRDAVIQRLQQNGIDPSGL